MTKSSHFISINITYPLKKLVGIYISEILRFHGIPYNIVSNKDSNCVTPYLSNHHNVFHVSQLRKYIPDMLHVIQSDDVQVRDNLTYETSPLQIED